MQAIMTIGLDIAKSVLQVHGVDAATKPANVKKALVNPEPSTHGTSRHFGPKLRVVAI